MVCAWSKSIGEEQPARGRMAVLCRAVSPLTHAPAYTAGRLLPCRPGTHPGRGCIATLPVPSVWCVPFDFRLWRVRFPSLTLPPPGWPTLCIHPHPTYTVLYSTPPAHTFFSSSAAVTRLHSVQTPEAILGTSIDEPGGAGRGRGGGGGLAAPWRVSCTTVHTHYK